MRPATAFLLATGVVALLGGCDRKKAPPPQPQQPQVPAEAPPAQPSGTIDRSRKGAAVPAVPIARLDGAPATLAAFRGKPLLVNLWATWCGPCIRELPTLDALATSEPDIHVVAVSQDAKASAIAGFLAKHPLPHLTVLSDTRNVLIQKFGADTLPQTILFDAHGREVWRLPGDLDWRGEKARLLVAEAH